MSGRLVGEVVGWLQTGPAAGLTLAERSILLIVAERSHETTREMWRHRIDDTTLYERIRAATGLGEDGLTKAFGRLASRGLEVRVPIGEGRDGRPLYARRGVAMKFRLPELPAAVTLPEPVDNPPAEPVDNPPGDADSPDVDPGYEAKAPTHVGANRPIARTGVHPYPSKDLPSTTDPSTSVRSLPPGVEGSRARPRDVDNHKIGFDYGSACAYLLTLPGDVQAAATAEAMTDLGDGALPQDLRIRAAEIAARGLTA